MSTKWIKIYNDVEGCSNAAEVDTLLKACGVEGNRTFDLIRKALSNYAYNRDYREKRNQSMTSMRKEISDLKAAAKK